MALAGRQTFNTFNGVVRLRRIRRQEGAGGFKDPTRRLRDADNTVDDYELWKTRELDSVYTDAACPRLVNDGFLGEDLVLVPEYAVAGKVNGKQLAARAPLHAEPGPASSAGVVVRCEARHSQGRGEYRKADEFRNVYQATHL